ncbi:hypothetical protein FMM05_00125 [Flavobacterium zepuense]|uniref:Uncharacterized protein n=1 Tax=Flavobacterium zepuense TaxID=2593302 RepID=A0A552V9F4_9FLAO|nr:hypothetical protein [Flavobacterium zepuense]TRW27092.1 hypothetical protein FMM05_00125 [Flavobacterium zepuense]
MKTQLLFVLRILGTAILIMIIDVLLSVLEVFIYARFVPDKPASFYDAHALQSAPWVSGIAGGFLMFVFTRHYMNKKPSRHLLYSLTLPTVYTLIDICIIVAIQADLKSNYPTYIIATLAKYAGALIAYFNKPKITHENISSSGRIF